MLNQKTLLSVIAMAVVGCDGTLTPSPGVSENAASTTPTESAETASAVAYHLVSEIPHFGGGPVEPQQPEEPELVVPFLFAAPTTAMHVDTLGGFTAADVNGDGLPDMVTLDEDEGLRWYEARKIGEYSEQLTEWGPEIIDEIVHGLPVICHGLEVPILTWTPLLDSGDLDGDGQDELVVWMQFQVTASGTTQSAIVTIDLQDGNQPAWEVVFISSTADVRSTVLADLDGDGGAEILVHDRYGFHLQRSGGEIEEMDSSLLLVEGMLRAWAYDIDGTGNLDIVAFINWSQEAAMVGFVANENGGYDQAWTEPVASWGLAHANGNAWRPATEILFATDDHIKWLAADGLAMAHAFTDINTSGAVFGDFDGNTTLDMVSRHESGPNETAGLMGDGQGGFGPTSAQLDFEYGEQVADLDSDGLDDIYRWIYSGSGSAYHLDILRNISED